MFDTKATADGGIRIEIDGKAHEIPNKIASAFISRVLHQMQQQAKVLGSNSPEGGAVLHPDSCAVEFDRESGEPMLRIGFGKALFVIAMPPGQMKAVAQVIASGKPVI